MVKEIDFGDCIFLKSETKEFMNHFLRKWDISNLLRVKFKQNKISNSEFKILKRIAIIRDGIKKYFSIFCYLPNLPDREKVKFRKRGAMYENTNRTFKEYYTPGVEIPIIKDMHVHSDDNEEGVFLQGRLINTVNIDGAVEATYNLFKANRIVWDIEKFGTIDEIAVWLFAREIYNFLITTQQITGEAKLEMAFEFGVNVLRDYRIYAKEFLDYLKKRERFVSTIPKPNLENIVTATSTIDSQRNKKVVFKKYIDSCPTNKKIERRGKDKTMIKILLKYHRNLVPFASQGYTCYKCKAEFSQNQRVEWIDKREGTFECPKCSEVLKVY